MLNHLNLNKEEINLERNNSNPQRVQINNSLLKIKFLGISISKYKKRRKKENKLKKNKKRDKR